jgi:tRNA A-37 threonylcarbamoyl transferase component Bud32
VTAAGSPASAVGRRYEDLRLPGGWKARVLVGDSASQNGRPGLTTEDWRQVLPTLIERIDRPEDGHLLKYSSSGWVQQVRLAFPSGEVEVICKHSRPKTLWRRALFWLRGPRECQQWRQAQWLQAAGIRTARPLALLIRRGRGWSRRGFIVTEWISDADDLFWFVHHVLPRLLSHGRRQMLSRLSMAVAEVFAGLHHGRLYHRDLKASNLLVTGGRDRGIAPAVWLVDVDGLRRVFAPRRSRLTRHLGRLAASLGERTGLSQTERLRFLKALLGAADPDAAWRTRWRQVAKFAERHARQADVTRT